jgi:stress response protein YsnF
VVVGKVATERTEQIKDSVRHTEVDVEETPANKDRY